jgi:hypothetical protein
VSTARTDRRWNGDHPNGFAAVSADASALLSTSHLALTSATTSDRDKS